MDKGSTKVLSRSAVPHERETFAGPSSSSLTSRSERRTRTTKRRARISSLDKRNICIYQRDNPNASQCDVARKFGVDRSTVSKILRHRDVWAHPKKFVSDDYCRHHFARHYVVEDSLSHHLSELSDPLGKPRRFTDAYVIREAKRIHSMLLCAPPFKASASWLRNFKKRYRIRGGVLHGRGSEVERYKALCLGDPEDFSHDDSDWEERILEAFPRTLDEDGHIRLTGLANMPFSFDDLKPFNPADLGKPQSSVPTTQTLVSTPSVDSKNTSSTHSDVPHIPSNSQRVKFDQDDTIPLSPVITSKLEDPIDHSTVKDEKHTSPPPYTSIYHVRYSIPRHLVTRGEAYQTLHHLTRYLGTFDGIVTPEQYSVLCRLCESTEAAVKSRPSPYEERVSCMRSTVLKQDDQ